MLGASRQRQQDALRRLLLGFSTKLAGVRVRCAVLARPACGSRNFLYVALKHLLDLEKEVITFPWHSPSAYRMILEQAVARIRG